MEIDQLARFIQTYQTIIASIIAVVLGVIGWIINYQLTLRVQHKNHILAIKAQNNNLLNQLYNTARVEITTSLRGYKEFLTKLAKYYEHIGTMYKNGLDFHEISKTYISILRENNTQWEQVIVGYTSLLPELEDARNKLNIRSNEIRKFIRETLTDDGKFTLETFKAITSMAFEIQPVILDQISLIDDLMTYLQVRAFANISDNPMPILKFDQEDRPRFIIENGNLKYIEGKVESA